MQLRETNALLTRKFTFHVVLYSSPNFASLAVCMLACMRFKVRCVGECGLDYSEGFPSAQLQLPWFERQVELACKVSVDPRGIAWISAKLASVFPPDTQ